MRLELSALLRDSELRSLSDTGRSGSSVPVNSPHTSLSVLARRMRRVTGFHEIEGLLVHQPLTLSE
jgi:hypothetical protein